MLPLYERLGTRPRCAQKRLEVCRAKLGMLRRGEQLSGELLASCWCACTYRVDLQIPRLARHIQVNSNLLILQAQLLEGDVGAVSPGAAAVGVEDDLGGGHGVNCNENTRGISLVNEGSPEGTVK